MEEITILPATAWQQGLFVCLFIVVLVILLRHFGKSQSDWQKFIQERDEQWQKFLTSQRDIDQQRYESVEETVATQTKVLSELVGKVQDLTTDFRAHDAMEREVLKTARPKRSKAT